MRQEQRFMRYESKYLNCNDALIISYLYHLKYPVELLFYRSLENTGIVHDHFIVHKGEKWNYPHTLLANENLLLLNVHSTQRRSDSFREVESEIGELLHADRPVFLSVDMFHLQHKTEQYLQSSLPHTVMLVEQRCEGGENRYRLFDDNYRHVSHYDAYLYSGRVIEKGFNSPASHHSFTSLQLTPTDPNTVANEARSAFPRWLAAYDDDLQYYDSLLRYLSDFADIASVRDQYERWCASLALITASRKLFVRYLQAVNGPAFLIEKLLASAHLGEIIKNQLRKKAVLSQTDTAPLMEKCIALKKIEWETIQSLKDYYL